MESENRSKAGIEGTEGGARRGKVSKEVGARGGWRREEPRVE